MLETLIATLTNWFAQTVIVPLWALWLAGLLATMTILDYVLRPTVRWYFRLRLSRAVETLNRRLQLKIPRFKLTQRHILVDRLVNDPQIAEAILQKAREDNAPYVVIERHARRYAREIVPSFSALGYFGFALKTTRWLSRMLYTVRLHYQDEPALKQIKEDSTVIFIMNHRSNMDYILVTYLAGERSALAYAVGEWARVWPLKQLVRAMGAYFIRRQSRNDLYRAVLNRYIQMATQGGVAQAIFPEGGLSRDGGLQPLKLGLISYIINGFETHSERDIVFVPVGLNYDRVLEDSALIRLKKGDKIRFHKKIAAIIRAMKWYLWVRIVTRFRRFGYAAVAFGTPLSYRDFIAQDGMDSPQHVVKMLSKELQTRLLDAIPIMPTALLAQIILRDKTPMGKTRIKAEVTAQLQAFRKNGVDTWLRGTDMEQGLEFSLKSLVRRGVLQFDAVDGKDVYRINPAKQDLLRYYANSIAHLDFN